MDLDINKLEKVITYFLGISHEPDDEKIVGENISPFPELKVIFDGYGYNEDTDEDDDENFESYAIFIHKDLQKEGFEFPEHESTPWAIVHRPTEEVCIHAQLDVNDEIFHINYDFENSAISNEQLNSILDFLEEKYLD